MSTSPTTEPGFQIGDRIELNVDAHALRQGLLPLDPVLASVLSQADVVIDANDESTALQFNVEQSAFKSVKHLRPVLAKNPVRPCLDTPKSLRQRADNHDATHSIPGTR